MSCHVHFVHLSLVRVEDVQGVPRRYAVRDKKDHPYGGL